MSQVPSTTGTSSNALDQPFGDHNSLNNLNLDSFLKLMISELQHQDPLNPMDNTQMLDQINQMRQIGATDKLTSTLNSVLLGQSISSATNLIGADVDAVSDDNQKVTGTVTKVTIENGQPKLQLDLSLKADPSIEDGNLGKGKYSYRVVWEDENGKLSGIELSGDKAITTTDTLNDYKSIRLSNLPITPGQKRIYRTDASGQGDYRLVDTITDGSQSSYLDTTADDDRSETRQTTPFASDPDFGNRSFKVSLNNVAEIRPPGT
jgi:flagellar basal-body rod modification protein FlgD